MFHLKNWSDEFFENVEHLKEDFFRVTGDRKALQDVLMQHGTLSALADGEEIRGRLFADVDGVYFIPENNGKGGVQ